MAISTGWIIVLVILAIWEMIWKGLALWKAAQNKHKAWFVVILIVNTIGILPIIYLIKYQPREKYIHLKAKNR